jgi:uncharacterized integral membrane protein
MSDKFLSSFSKLPDISKIVILILILILILEMSNRVLSSFSKLIKTTQYSNTLPTSQCSGGFPVDKYAGYGLNSLEVLYSIWNSYQSTIGAQFTQSQSNISAPTLPTTMIGPKNIFIIRHGEKTNSTVATTTAPANIQYHINQNGVYRACQIPTLVNELATIGYPITYMVSTNPCPLNAEDPSMRNQQTISMASFLLNIPMFIFGSSNNTQAAADALFDTSPTNPFNGLNILICWEHTKIQDLCLKLMDKSLLVGRSTKTADEFFAQSTVTEQTCVGGTYLAPAGSGNTPFNVKVETSPEPHPTYDYPAQHPATVVYPFWNVNNFDNMFCFTSNLDNTEFDFILENQKKFNCLTCYANCELKIGLFQAQSNCTKPIYYYPNSTQLETECLPPTEWAYSTP